MHRQVIRCISIPAGAGLAAMAGEAAGDVPGAGNPVSTAAGRAFVHEQLQRSGGIKGACNGSNDE